MSTTSSITAKCKDGRFRSIYVHWDGHIEWVGRLLLENYTEQDKIEKLLSLGSISILAPSIECPEGHTFDSPIDGYTIAYYRDRDRAWGMYHTIVEDTRAGCLRKNGQEYNYFWDGEKWTVGYSFKDVFNADLKEEWELYQKEVRENE